MIQKYLLHFLIFIGALSWYLTVVKSGWIYDYGMGFWGANGHDGVWHIALINSLARGSFDMPVFAGSDLKNYHIGFDYLLAILHNITRIPTVNLYFHIIPPIVAVLLGILTYKLVYFWKDSKQQAIWSVFFVYFAGSWGWLVSLFRNGDFGGESMFWSTQAISTLINPPFALSLVVMLLGIYSLARFKKYNSHTFFIITLVSFGVLVEIKAYAGILAYIGLGIITLIETIKRRNVFNPYTLLLSVSLIISLALFLPLYDPSSGLLIFQPFWFLETMMAVSDRVNWPRYYEAMLNWKSGDIWYKAIPAYIIAFVIFWFGNMGTRIIKEPLMYKWTVNFKQLSTVELFMGGVMIGGIVLSLLFVQKGNPWNTIQFLYYSLFFASITAGISTAQLIDYLQKRKLFKISYVVGVAIVLLTIPTTLSNLWYIYLPNRPPAKISMGELEALSFLKKQPQGVVLTYPYDEKKALAAIANPPRPLYLYESTSYVSAFSNKEVYLEDEVNLDIMDYDWKKRRESLVQFYKSNEEQDIRNFLRENNISYVYWVKGQRATLGETQLCISRLFENKEVDIYKVENPESCPSK